MTKDALRRALRPVPISRRLAVAIAAANVKKQDIAKRSGLNVSVFSKIVVGHRPTSPDEREAIARAIGLSVLDLFGEAA